MLRPFASPASVALSRESGSDLIEMPPMPGGIPGVASPVPRKNTIPTASRPTRPPTTIASLVFP